MEPKAAATEVLTQGHSEFWDLQTNNENQFYNKLIDINKKKKVEFFWHIINFVFIMKQHWTKTPLLEKLLYSPKKPSLV